jgi:hypothetical protein
MIWDEKVMIFRGFSCRIDLWHCAHIKRMDTDVIFDISDPKKNTRISNSKFCQRNEDDLSRKHSTFTRLICIGLPTVPVQAMITRIRAFDVLASLTKFRVGNSCIFFRVRNVGNNVRVHSFDVCAMPETNST